MPIRYGIDTLTPNEVVGWACCSDHFTPVLVKAILRGKLIARAVADQYRQDLRAASIGDGYHAFIVNFSEPIGEEDVSHFELRFSDGMCEEIGAQIPALE